MSWSIWAAEKQHIIRRANSLVTGSECQHNSQILACEGGPNSVWLSTRIVGSKSGANILEDTNIFA